MIRSLGPAVPLPRGRPRRRPGRHRDLRAHLLHGLHGMLVLPRLVLPVRRRRRGTTSIAPSDGARGRARALHGRPRESLVARREWNWTTIREFPGGRQTRTSVEDGACVFRSRTGRGCMLHSFALDRGLDYHELKPWCARSSRSPSTAGCSTRPTKSSTAPSSASMTGRRSTKGFAARSNGTSAPTWWPSSTR